MIFSRDFNKKSFRIKKLPPVFVAGLFLIFYLVTSFFTPNKAFAATYYWVGGAAGDTNNWHNSNNWSSSSGGGGGAGIPGSGDAVIFDNGSSVACIVASPAAAGNITNTNYAGSLTFSSGAGITLMGNLSYRSGVLNLGSGMHGFTGNIDLRGASVDAGASTILWGGGSAGRTIYGGNQTLSNLVVAMAQEIPYVAGGTSNFKISGTLNIMDSASLVFNLNTAVTMLAGSTLNLNTSGLLDRNSTSSIIFEDATTSSISGSGTIEIDTVFKTVAGNAIIPNRAYANLYVKNETINSRIAILGTAGSQTISANSLRIYAEGAGNITLDGDTYDPTVNVSQGLNTATYFDFAGSGGGSEIINTGSGTWSIGSSTVDLRDGTLNAGSSNFVFNRVYSSTAQTVYSGGNSFYQITNANNDYYSNHGLIFLDSVTANTFTYTSPVRPYITQFQPGTTATFNTFNVSGDASNNIVFQPYGSSASWYLDLANPATVSYVTVSYSDASGGEAINAYDGTNINGGNNLNWNFTEPSNDKYWVASSSGVWSDDNNWASSSGGAGGAGTPESDERVFFDSNGAGNCLVDEAIDIATLDLTGYEGEVDFSTHDIAVSGDVDLSSASIDGGSSDLQLDGSSAQTLTAAGQTLYDLTITNSDTTSGVVFVGSLTVGGTFLDEVASHILTFDNSASYTINNLTLNGQATGTRITLQSDAGDSQWGLAVSGSQSISNVSVSDSDASDGDEIDADDGTNENGGNNLNWLWPPSSYYWVGSTSSWNTAGNWSDSSGGAGGAGVPGANDTAIFDDQDGTDCTIDTIVSVAGITNTNYSGHLDADSQNIAISGDLIYQSGTLSLGSDGWSVGGNVDFTGATINADDSTFVMSGNNKTLTLDNATLNNLMISNSTSSDYEVVISDNLTLDGNLTVYAGGSGDATIDFDTNDGDVTVGGNVDFTGNGAGNEIISMGDGSWAVAGNIDLRNGQVNANGSTLAMSGTNKTIYGNSQTFNDLRIVDIISVPYIYNGSSNFSISGTLNVSPSDELKLNLGTTITMLKDSSLVIAGTISKNGGGSILLIDPNDSSVTKTGSIEVPMEFRAVTASIAIPALNYESDLSISSLSSLARSAILGTSSDQSISVNGSFMIYANSSGDITVDGATYNPNVSTSNYGGYRRYLGFFGTGSGDEILNAGSGTWTIGASDVDFRNGTLNAGTSAFSFNRSYSIYYQTIYSGGNSFNKIINSNSNTRGNSGLIFLDDVRANDFTYTSPISPYITQFKNGITANFASLNISGQSGKILIFKPYGVNGQWYLNTQSQSEISYVNVSYSNASGGKEIIASNGTNIDSGNNTNWRFNEDEDSEESGDSSEEESSSNEQNEEQDEPGSTNYTSPYPDPSAQATTTANNNSEIESGDNASLDGSPYLIRVRKNDYIVGTTSPNSKVELVINGVRYEAISDKSGKWKVLIGESPGEYDAKMIVTDPSGKIERKDALVVVLPETAISKILQNRGSLAYLAIPLALVLILISIAILKKRNREEQEPEKRSRV